MKSERGSVVVHWVIAAVAGVMLTVLCAYGTRMGHDLPAPPGALEVLYGWSASLLLAHMLAASGARVQIATSWASYLVAAFVLRQLLVHAPPSATLVGGVGLIGLGLADIVRQPSVGSRRLWLMMQILVVTGLLSAWGSRHATAIDAQAVESSWPSPSWNEPTLRAWFTAQARVPAAKRGCAVMVFLDYQCPPCAAVHREFGERLHRPDVCVLDYPLDSECNPHVSEAAHELACELAVLVRLTRVRDASLARQREAEIFGSAVPRRYVQARLRDLGVAGPDDPRYREALRGIRADVELGRRLGVESTPTFILNGTRVPGAVAADVYDRLLTISQVGAAGETGAQGAQSSGLAR